MPETIFILNDWLQDQADFRKKLLLVQKSPEKNALHDLRVAIKKMRALLELYILLSGEKLMEDPLHKTKELFKTVGKQRDLEICLECLEKYKRDSGVLLPESKAYFENILQKARQWTTEAVKAYSNKEPGRIKTLLSGEKEMLSSEQIVSKAIQIILAELMVAEGLYRLPHKLRQHLKKIFYWVKTLPGNLQDWLYEKDLHQLCNDLGIWQDNDMFINKIKHFRKDILPATHFEYQQIKYMQETMVHQQQQLLKSSLQETKRLLKKIKSLSE
jgi:CHAD domain-containing protein